MRIGYIEVGRVVDRAWLLNEQLRKIEEHTDIDRLYIDYGADEDGLMHPQLNAMLSDIDEGDTVYVSDFGRFDHDLQRLVVIIQDFIDLGVQVIECI